MCKGLQSESPACQDAHQSRVAAGWDAGGLPEVAVACYLASPFQKM